MLLLKHGMVSLLFTEILLYLSACFICRPNVALDWRTEQPFVQEKEDKRHSYNHLGN